MKQKILITIGVLVALYVGISVTLYSQQESLVFYPKIANGRGPLTPAPEHFKEISLTTKDGVNLHGLQTAKPTENPYIVFFGGNAQNLVNFSNFLHKSLPNVNLVGFNYRGFGKSEGTPTKKHLIQDVHEVALWVRNNLPPDAPIYSLGLSLGTGPATKYAALTQAEGLLLVMPYDTLAKVAADAYPLLPTESLFNDNFVTTSYMAKYEGPVGIVVAADDKLIRPKRSRALARHVKNLVVYQELPDQTHASMIDAQVLSDWLRKAFKELRP